MRRALLVVGLVVAVAVFATGLARWSAADGELDDARAARDEQAAATDELRAEVDGLEELAADAAEQAGRARDAVARVVVQSDDHLEAARRLLAGREEQVRRLRTQDFTRYGQFINDLERQEDAVHESQVDLLAALDPLVAALLELEQRLAAVEAG